MKQTKSAVRFFVLLILLGGLHGAWEDRLEFILRMPLTPRRLEMLWNYNRPALIMTVAMAILAVATVISFFQMIRDFSKPAAKRNKSSIPAPEVKVRGAALKHPDEAEEAIHCAHLTGRQKYLEQIDGYLRTGLIDRSEYRVLKERYMNLDIPDDYH